MPSDKPTIYKPDYQDALNLIRERVKPAGGFVRVPLENAAGRLAAETVCAPTPFPAQALAIRDGHVASLAEGVLRSQPIRTAERVPTWAHGVVAHEEGRLEIQAASWGEPSADRPHVIERGREYSLGTVLLDESERIDRVKLSAIRLFQIENLKVRPALNIRVFIFNGEPFSSAISMWLRGFGELLRDIELSVRKISQLDQIKPAEGEFDLGLIVSDSRPGRYEQIKQLGRGDLPGFEMVFWKVGLYPGKHMGFGVYEDTPYLVFPDIFSKTVLAGLAFLPEIVCHYARRSLHYREVSFTERPALIYPFPTLVPLAFDRASPLEKPTLLSTRSSLSAHFVASANGYAIVQRDRQSDRVFQAVDLLRETKSQSD